MADVVTINEVESVEETQMPETKAVAALMVEVEVKRWHGAGEGRVFGWQRMPVREALRLQDETFRCPECLGRVKLKYGSAEKATSDRAEHYSKNVGCSLGDCFGGEKKQHSKPIL